MSPKLRAEIGHELAQMRRMLDDSSSHIQAALHSPPDDVSAWDIAAMGAILHAFYNGIENCFRRIASELDKGLPSGADWHDQLLQRMILPGPTRPAVIDTALADRLREYMGFRHVFRHSYSFHLRWVKMRPLVAGVEVVFDEFQKQVTASLGPMTP